MRIISARYLEFKEKTYAPGDEIPKNVVTKEHAVRMAAEGKVVFVEDDQSIPREILQNSPTSFAVSKPTVPKVQPDDVDDDGEDDGDE